MAWKTAPTSAVPPATVARGTPVETGRVRSSLGRRSTRMEAIGKNLAMPPSDPEASGTDRDVLTSLPRTRPSRRSAKRDRPVRAGTTPPEDTAAPAAPPGAPTPPPPRPPQGGGQAKAGVRGGRARGRGGRAAPAHDRGAQGDRDA